MKQLGRKKIYLLLVLVAVALGLGSLYAWDQSHKVETVITATQKTQLKPPEPSGVLRFAAMGDMLAHDSVIAQAKRGETYDFKPYFAGIRPLYESADAVFCNAEGLTTGAQFGVSGYPSFNAPTEFARDLVEGAGCNVIGLANNHMNDKGQTAIDANVAVWENLHLLAFSGANRSPEEQAKVQYFTKNGVKVGFVAFADYSNNKNLTSYGVNIYHNTDLVKRLLSEARANADAVIVSAHWGTEDANVVNADQTAAAQLLADSGADVVIGTGPHVLQPVKIVAAADGRKTLVWYSIGNMLSSQLKANELTGVIAGFTLTQKKDGGVLVSSPTAQITFMSYDWAAADKTAQLLETRSNLQLRTLRDSGDTSVNMFGSQYTQAERESYVRSTLGTEAAVVITP
ncbi:CapA family protein [Candidatus Saccharibacteria bacterium]|nr:MAG: CapA family protein [Candidatus Saccharibacteria bacterium]